MKKIVPFNNVLEFTTDVKEITAISLEHEISKSPDMVSGVFYISGEYKISEALLDKEQFNFELPFDIALSSNYNLDTLIVDIDDFRYDLISDKSLKVNIDLYIDGEVEEPLPRTINEESLEFSNLENQEDNNCLEEKELLEDLYEKDMSEKENDIDIPNEKDIQSEMIETERIDLLQDMLSINKEKEMTDNQEINISNTNTNVNNSEDINKNINLFEGNPEENYVTYRVYVVEENDTIDTILNKYNITKDLLQDYNNIENIKTGDKLIIPTNEK